MANYISNDTYNEPSSSRWGFCLFKQFVDDLDVFKTMVSYKE